MESIMNTVMLWIGQQRGTSPVSQKVMIQIGLSAICLLPGYPGLDETSLALPHLLFFVFETLYRLGCPGT